LVNAPKLCEEGDIAGNYDEEWTKTFDLVFLIFMVASLGLLLIATALWSPQYFSDPHFWIMQLPKMLVMILVSFLGGLACRFFCEVDSQGYIITNKHSAFKVNYTRKLQHFAAYAVPLVLHSKEPGVLPLAWGDWFTLMGFALLIKPIRERSKFFMLQFNSLDRPEDRPHTLDWIVAGNIIPGLVLIIFFRWLYSYSGQVSLTFIFIMITGIGDGLAEPVGIYWGRHKYFTSAMFSDRKYQRSLEGSACVFLSGMIFSAVYWYAFQTRTQFWIASVVLPPAMAYAEAVSPHTIDTPFLMTLGGFILLVISHVTVTWA